MRRRNLRKRQQKWNKNNYSGSGNGGTSGRSACGKNHPADNRRTLAAAEGPAGLDALLSTVQMPPGVPVASMAIGKAGAKNAAIFAVQILALNDAKLNKKLADFRKAQAQKVIEKDKGLQK